MPVAPLADRVELNRRVVNTPAAGLDAPMVSPLAVPPVMATASAPCVDIVPKPVIAVLGIVALAVIADVPLPMT